MTEIYLIRHAEAEGNLFRRIQGQRESQVTANGLRQIAALERRFASVSIDACYSSDFIRTRTTAQAICRPKGLRLQEDPAFREVRLGVWENQTFGWLYTFEPEAMDAFNNDPRHWRVEGAERFQDYAARFLEAMTRHAQAHDGGAIAIVSHGAVLRGVFMTLFPQDPPRHSANTAVSLLRYADGQYEMVYAADSSHLNPTGPVQQKWTVGGGADASLWFRPGETGLPDLTPPDSETVFTAMLGQTPVGLVCLSDGGADTGRLDYLGLIPACRRRNLAVQLVGQAVYYHRCQGKTRLVFSPPEENEAFARLCRRFRTTPGHDGQLEMDIALM